jgi:hypothetical protein
LGREGPVALVDVDVVAFAEEGEVGEGGFAAVGPVGDVVGFAHGWWGVADQAALISDVEGVADGGGDEAVFGAYVQGFGGGA